MAGASSVAYIAASAGDITVAESWLRKARATAAALEVFEVGLLESFACLALSHGDLEEAAQRVAELRRAFESQELPNANPSDALTLFTDLYLAKRQGQKQAQAEVLHTLRAASDALNDEHLDLLVTLAEAEAQFDGGLIAEARATLQRCLGRSPDHLMYVAELNRMLARSLWIDGHRRAATRRLLRASASAFVRGTRMAWTETLREARTLSTGADWEVAYSVDTQRHLADTKFAALASDDRPTWFARTTPPREPPRDALDGFDDALGILSMIGDAELRGREAFASVIALNLIDRGALIARSDNGVRIVAAHRWTEANFDRARKQDPSLEHLMVGGDGRATVELVLKARADLRARTAISGIRRLLEAARAIESKNTEQPGIGALWQPEIIVEEPDAIFSSPLMIELMQTARKVAATTLPVLLMGDTGTGKEVFARAIHRASPRASKTFLPFNCSAVPRDMVESQLFGYRRGSFTGATVDFPGIIRSAEGGTLFLDEIGELSIDLQPKLLRFLETHEVHPLGEGKPIAVDVRVIAATNENLDDLIQLKEFREDLYYRLNIVRFQVPQLRERREEIPPLALHLLRRFEMAEKKHGIQFSDELIEYLLLYNWPGNVRQLSNELRRMTAMVASGETLTPDHLSPAIRATRRTVAVDPEQGAAPPAVSADTDPAVLTIPLDQLLPDAVASLERAMVERALDRTNGRLEDAARRLGISRKGLFLKRRRWSGAPR